MEKTPDREKLEQVAKGYHDLIALQAKQKATTAKMIRACVARIKSPDAFGRGRPRQEGIKGLEDLAAMLEGEATRMEDVKPKD